MRPPRSMRAGLDDDRIIFKKLISKLKQAKYTIVYIDECSFNSSALPLYTWMKRGEPPSKMIRDGSHRYNAIAAQWHDYVYFELKEEMSTEVYFTDFIRKVYKQLQHTISKSQLSKRTVVVFDNARIHKTERVRQVIKDYNLIVFTIPPYSPEMNRIEHTFGKLKKAIACRNLSGKNFLHVIKEEIAKL